MQLIKDPSQFDVLLCSNPLGDILSDECAMIIGLLMGMLPSASLMNKVWPGRAGGRFPPISTAKISPTRSRRSFPWLWLLRYSLDADEAATAIGKR